MISAHSSTNSFQDCLPELSHCGMQPQRRLSSSTFHFTGCVFLHNKNYYTLFYVSVKTFWYYWLRFLDSNQASRINSPPPSPRLLNRNILVPLHRIELQITDYKTVVIPFNYKGKFMTQYLSYCTPVSGEFWWR